MTDIPKIRTFNILKKDRKYFAAMVDGYKCRIVIDEASMALVPGPDQTLEVLDRSVRSRYGTDLIFQLAAVPNGQGAPEICTLRHDRYNTLLVDKCRKLGGRWDATAKAWIFSGLVSREVDDLDDLFNGDQGFYEIEFLADEFAPRGSISILGYPLATAKGRDSGARLEVGVALIEGEFSSGGSYKNWGTTVDCGTIVRLSLPIALVNSQQTKSTRSIKLCAGNGST